LAANVVAVAIISTPERLSLWGAVGDVADKNAHVTLLYGITHIEEGSRLKLFISDSAPQRAGRGLHTLPVDHLLFFAILPCNQVFITNVTDDLKLFAAIFIQERNGNPHYTLIIARYTLSFRHLYSVIVVILDIRSFTNSLRTIKKVILHRHKRKRFVTVAVFNVGKPYTVADILPS